MQLSRMQSSLNTGHKPSAASEGSLRNMKSIPEESVQDHTGAQEFCAGH